MSTSLPDIIDPLTGEVLDLDSIDALADAYQRITETMAALGPIKQAIAKRLGDMTEGEARTRRLRGETTRVKVEMPADSYDSGQLQSALNAFPKLGAEYLRIARVEPIRSEVKKLASESGGEAFKTFKGMVMAANNGQTGTPKITIERKGDA